MNDITLVGSTQTNGMAPSKGGYGYREQGRQDYLVEQRDDIGFEGIDNINLDSDLWFKMRGHSLNPLVDACSSLFGLVQRMRDLDDNQDVEKLYMRVKGDISAIDEEVRQLTHYNRATQIACNYCLCAFIDEAVMNTTWGINSMWTQNSMLSVYHQETWGGEKFFVILKRMMQEPEVYKDMLEYIYLMLSLGFKGKYGTMHDGQQQLNDIIHKLHHMLRELKGESPQQLLPASANIGRRKFRIRRQIPLWSVWATLLAVLVGTYTYYAISVSRETEKVVQQLGSILQ